MTIVLATRNRHKVEEIRAILSEQFKYQTLNDYPGAPAVIEDAPTFTGNATKKATELAAWLGERSPPAENKIEPRYVLADDSGLEVDALHGAPGVHSARFAALDEGHIQGADQSNSSDAENNAKLLRVLAKVPTEKRLARFRCTLALTPVIIEEGESSSPVCYANAGEFQTEIFEGVCEGRIGLAASGRGGFGYDPLFVPMGYEQSFAELGEEVKNRISHRAQALQKLRVFLTKR